MARGHQTHETNDTSCAACAADEGRPLRLLLKPAVAKALMRVAEAHEARAKRGMRGSLCVFIDTNAIVAELIAREGKRLRAGGRLPPRFRAVRVEPVSQGHARRREG